MAVQAHEKGLGLVGEVAPDMPTELVGDPTRLRQVLEAAVTGHCRVMRAMATVMTRVGPGTSLRDLLITAEDGRLDVLAPCAARTACSCGWRSTRSAAASRWPAAGSRRSSGRWFCEV